MTAPHMPAQGSAPDRPGRVVGLPASPAVFCFGAFVLDTARRVLERDGAEIRLRPKSLDVLEYLVRHPGRLVTKDELLTRVWAPAVVTEGALTQCLIDVRRALGDETHAMVRTVHGRGVRFDVPVKARAAGEERPGPGVRPAVPRPGRTYRSLLLGAIGLGVATLGWWGVATWRALDADPADAIARDMLPAAVRQPPRVVVNPFSASGLGGEAAEERARAARDAVIARLAAIKSLNVAEPGRSAAWDFVLDGTIDADTDRVRTTIRLTAAQTGDVLWSRTFEQPAEAREFARASLVAHAVEGLVAPYHLTRSIDSTLVPESARREYFLGEADWWLWVLGVGGNPRVAADHYQRATTLAPRFWLPYSALAILHSNRLVEGPPFTRQVEAAHAAARELMAERQYDHIRPVPMVWELPVALVLYRLDLDYAYAELLMERARERGWQAGQVNFELAWLHGTRGDQERALALVHAAIDGGAQLNQSVALLMRGGIELGLGRYDAARRSLDGAAEHALPGTNTHKDTTVLRVLAHALTGDGDTAGRILDEAWALYGASHPERFPGMLALLGRSSEARVLLYELEQRFRENRLSYVSSTFLGHYFLGDFEQAFVWLERLIENREWWFFGYLRGAPFLEPLRADARYAKAMARLEAIEARGSPLRAEIDAALAERDLPLRGDSN
jgi:DNA-binding winged helix-turn-helix (wHTH) protein/TolB-like protein/tetratricopeptide (TPR) repeat protein